MEAHVCVRKLAWGSPGFAPSCVPLEPSPKGLSSGQAMRESRQPWPLAAQAQASLDLPGSSPGPVPGRCQASVQREGEGACVHTHV